MHIPLNTLAFGLPAGYEWVVILVVALLIFGRRLPTVMRSIGGSMREFKKGLSDGMGDDGEEDDAQNKKESKVDNTAPGAVSREKTSATESSEDDGNYDKGDDHQRSL